MIDHHRWRDQQLRNFHGVSDDAILAQEKVMLEFVTGFPGVSWNWKGNETRFKQICQQYINIVDAPAQGVILFGTRLNRLSSGSLVQLLKKYVGEYNYLYVAINRYEIAVHDIDLELPDSIDQALDCILHYCDPRFKRLHRFDQVDGNHMVAAHPMDCYGLCKL